VAVVCADHCVCFKSGCIKFREHFVEFTNLQGELHIDGEFVEKSVIGDVVEAVQILVGRR
jgi:hypothetical protein